MNGPSLSELFFHFGLSYASTVAIGLVCAYLGLFCVLRRIVFTGVALAQLAAAGVAAAFFVGDRAPPAVGHAVQAYGSTVGSLGAAILGAFGLQAKREQRWLTSDALVGLIYAAASALAIVLVWKSAHGLAELKNILAGEVLLPRKGELLVLWAGLTGVAVLHAVFRRQFLLVSYDPEFARALKINVTRFERLLLISLAIAVALSLRSGGLLLVFAFLVLPPLTGLALGEGLSQATLLALCAAAVATLAGFLVAIQADLPVAPAIALSLVTLVGLARAATVHPSAVRAARALMLVFGAAALLLTPVAGVTAALQHEHDHESAPLVAPDGHGHGPDDPHGHALPTTHVDQEVLDEVVHDLVGAPTAEGRSQAAARLAELGSDRAIRPLVEALADEDPAVRDAAAAAIAHLALRPGANQNLEDLLHAADPELRVRAAFACLRLGHADGIPVLVAALAEESVPLMLQDEILQRLRPLAGGESFDYDPFGTSEDNAAAAEAWRTWWEDTGSALLWDPDAECFR